MQDIRKATRHRAREVVALHLSTREATLRGSDGVDSLVSWRDLSKRELVRACVYMHPSTTARVWQPLSPRELRDRLVSGSFGMPCPSMHADEIGADLVIDTMRLGTNPDAWILEQVKKLGLEVRE